ncbi:helix-turn-helix transcriptional regulator [Solwaraspora sp. WMMD1047]|uniref:helix-turn-helix domain-containing protein n=1 Tax=Solwaraspora sp. WMMD1047 TaxID=3016102 RepID=UPI0024180255|nr:helix-turn-helix transcriptional regulator [Solwaraspora sp. WMMD1047]MDG4832237.1 helix-turn-helix transcriptional regulator [Solwaraspora sp. WMMD1047]
METLTEFLVAELRAARVTRDLSQEEFGKLIKYSGSHVSAVETGGRPVTVEYVEAVDRALQTGGFYTRLFKKVTSLELAPVWLHEWIELERQARSIRWYEPSFVPGLLQTEAYARATLLAGGRFAPDQAEKRVASRLDRQAILRAEKPPHFVAVLDEAVLRRTFGGDRAMMAEQLEHLATCAELPDVRILIVPAEVGLYPGLQGGFITLTLQEGTMIAHQDHQVKAQVVNGVHDIATLQETWDDIVGEALPRRQSLDLIKEAVKSWT